jgi:hypothetical protein
MVDTGQQNGHRVCEVAPEIQQAFHARNVCPFCRLYIREAAASYGYNAGNCNQLIMSGNSLQINIGILNKPRNLRNKNSSRKR